MDRAKIALTMLSIEFSNAKARQTKRMIRLDGLPDVMALAVSNELDSARLHLRMMRRSMYRILRLELIEHKRRELDIPARNRTPGTNRRQIGTYGR